MARHGVYLSDRPGHRKIATIAYLRERGVNLIIGHPVLVSREKLPSAYAVDDEWMRQMFVGKQMPDPQFLPTGVSMLEMPFDDTRDLLAIYLTADSALASKIKAQKWRLVPINRGAKL